MHSLRTYLKAVAAMCLSAAQPVLAQEPVSSEEVLTGEEVRQDLATWMEWTRSTHPDLSYSVNLETLDMAVAKATQSLPDTLSRPHAWKALATLNPLLNDAHVGLLVPPASDVPDSAPPIPISVAGETLMIAGSTGTGATPLEIIAFNSVPWAELAETAMPLLRGENDALRRFIIELRLHGLLRLILPGGEVKTMTLSSASGMSVEIPVDASRLRFVSGQAGDYAISFEGSTALLSVPSFSREREEEFTAFLERAFAAIADKRSQRLIIDISQNGGGAHDLSDKLMAYLTNQPFTATSAITARITPENQGLVPGSELGDVLTLPFAEPVIPPKELANRYSGEVLIKTGSKTYSQAIVFAATAQDIGVAKLIGEPPQAPANQTGQVQTFTLPNTGFVVRAPIYIIYRGSGDRSRDALKTENMVAP